MTPPLTLPDDVRLMDALRVSLARLEDGKGALYRKLADALKAAVAAGQLHTGQALPSERDMAEQLCVSRVTVRHAIDDLVKEGLLTVRRGAGAYVTARIEQPLSLLGSFTDDMRRRGYEPGSHWLSRELALPSPDELLALGLSGTDQVLRTARVRTATGEPLAIERATVPAALVGHTLAFGDSLYQAMEQHAARPARAVQRLRAEIASVEDAGLLNIAPGAAVLRIERRSFDARGRPVELTRSVYRGDLYDYVVELNTVA